MSIREDAKYSMKIKALYYLYEKNYTQTDVAEKLRISRVTLGKWLDEAKSEGMIRFNIVDARDELPLVRMEEELKSLFHPDDVRVFNAKNLDDAGIMWKIGSSAAAYIDQEVHSNMRIGVTWGRTLNFMVNELTVNPSIKGLEVYSLIGGTSSSEALQPGVLAQNFLNKYNGSLRILAAPFICSSEKLCEDLRKDEQIASVLEGMKNLDLTLVGIGEEPMRGSSVLGDYPFDADIIQELVDQQAVGDICGNFIDINGSICKTSLKKRTVSIDIRELRRHKKVVGIGGGSRKVRSILGALHGGYLDVLLTDSNTASAVIEMEKAYRAKRVF